MNRFIKIILILAVVTSLGFFLGVNQEKVSVRITSTSTPVQVNQLDSQPTIWPTAKQLESLPWYVTRSAAISAYLLLFAIVIWGLGMAVGWTYRFFDPARAWQIHQDMSISFGVLIIVHIVALLFDKFINFGLLDVFVPFYSAYNRLYLSLGIVGFYFLLAIILTSLFMRLKNPRVWRLTHYLVYPLFIFAAIHGIYMGTDSKTLIMQDVYQGTLLVFILIFAYRFLIYTSLQRLKIKRVESK